MNEIEYKTNAPIETGQIIELYKHCGLPRPIHDEKRITEMFANSNLVISAWFDGELVGVSRSLTDFVWCCYLADLAVRKDFQKAGVGRKLVEMTREKVSEKSMVLLLSVPDALGYYPKIGMEKVENGFIFNREF
ncbi:MAG: GNAT family N-acetyltransferase [Pyrinomonadaceae bacterium]|nr:GNAT family N-acetyltransferase [Pyrinomonadaceae bacterium]